MGNKASFMHLSPVLFCFYIMGFCNIVGISTSYMQIDFHLGNAVAGLLPAAVFIWFLLLSVPVTALVNKTGCKKTVLGGLTITGVGAIIPLLMYNPVGCLLAFSLLGIGNVLLQVALNPLLSCVAPVEALAASLTAGRMIATFSAFCGPFVAAFAMSFWGHWYYVFPAFAVVAFMSSLWLSVTPVRECGRYVQATSKETFSLLKHAGALSLFLAVFFVVGIDVGMNMLIPKLMMERCGNAIQDASLGSSVYFAFKVLGIFAGTILLASLSGKNYFRIHILIASVSLCLLFLVENEYLVLTLAGMVGFGCSSVFAVICSIALKVFPQRVNEISVLMMTAICGGTFIPLLMGVAAECVGAQTGALAVIAICFLYLLYFAFGKRISALDHVLYTSK